MDQEVLDLQPDLTRRGFLRGVVGLSSMLVAKNAGITTINPTQSGKEEPPKLADETVIPDVITELEDPQAINSLVSAYRTTLEMFIRYRYNPEDRTPNPELTSPTQILRSACRLAREQGVQDIQMVRSTLYGYLTENSISNGYQLLVDYAPAMELPKDFKSSSAESLQNLKDVISGSFHQLLYLYDPNIVQYYESNLKSLVYLPDIFVEYVQGYSEESFYEYLFQVYESNKDRKGDLSTLLAEYIIRRSGNMSAALFDLSVVTEIITRFNYARGKAIEEIEGIVDYESYDPIVEESEAAVQRIMEFGDPFSTFDAPYGMESSKRGCTGKDSDPWSRIGTLYHVTTFMHMLPHFPPHVIKAMALGELSGYGQADHGYIKMHSDATALLDLDNADRFLSSLNK